MDHGPVLPNRTSRRIDHSRGPNNAARAGLWRNRRCMRYPPPVVICAEDVGADEGQAVFAAGFLHEDRVEFRPAQQRRNSGWIAQGRDSGD